MARTCRLTCFLGASAMLTALCGLNPASLAAPVPSEMLETIDRMVREDIDKKTVASYSVAVVKDGGLALSRGYGWADLENDVPAMAETVYRLGSITKQFTAMAILQLAERNKLTLDDELTKFLPDYPLAGHKVTVKHLLNHTSGIKSYTGTKEFFKLYRQDLSHDELLAVFKDKPFEFEPGTKWNYNNSGYYLLGMIVEKASGQTYEKYLSEHVFRPLGMTATRFGHMQPIIRHRAMGYKLVGAELINDDPMSMNPPGAAGALVSNVLDLVKWQRALEAGELLSSASYEDMVRPTKLADGTTHPYGFGWALGELAGHQKISHGGGINGFSTMIGRYPSDRLCVIVLANTANANSGRLENRIARLLLGVKETPIVDLPTTADLLDRLTGNYEWPGGKVELTADNDKLYAKIADQPRDRLKYQGNLKFVSERNVDVRVTFQPAEGRAATFEAETDDGKFLVKRVE